MEIKLTSNNIYRNGRIVDLGENKLLLREKMRLEGETKDKYHTVTNSDSLLLIAHNSYKNTMEDASKLWWIIADANQIHNPMDLTDLLGKEVIIPNINNVLINLQ